MLEAGKNKPLKVLLVWAVTAGKLIPFKVLAPPALSVPVKAKDRALVITVPDEALLVKLTVWATALFAAVESVNVNPPKVGVEEVAIS